MYTPENLKNDSISKSLSIAHDAVILCENMMENFCEFWNEDTTPKCIIKFYRLIYDSMGAVESTVNVINNLYSLSQIESDFEDYKRIEKMRDTTFYRLNEEVHALINTEAPKPPSEQSREQTLIKDIETEKRTQENEIPEIEKIIKDIEAKKADAIEKHPILEREQNGYVLYMPFEEI